MTSTNDSTERAAPRSPSDASWTARTLISRHKRASTGVLALLVVMVALLVAGVVGARAGAVSDSTTCSEWGSANQNQQQAYASLYVREHGALRGGASNAASVEAAINKGCMQAFASDVDDSVNVYQAINNQY